MLPGMDGFSFAASLRAAGQRSDPHADSPRPTEDVLKGFEAGADDYLPKPFELSVLIARIRPAASTRVVSPGLERDEVTTDELTPQRIFDFSGKTIDFEALELRSGPQTVHLTVMEADLLRYLIKHDGKIVSRSAILEDVWGLREDTDTRAIDNFIVRLRKYIEAEPSRPRHLLTVRGVGYKFVSQS